jgi:hypothetical protein
MQVSAATCGDFRRLPATEINGPNRLAPARLRDAARGATGPNRFIDIWPPLRYVFLASDDHDYCAIAFRHELAAKDE